MKLDEFDWFVILVIPVTLLIIGGVITYDAQQQRVSFQQTYNRNLECRQAFKGQIVVKMNAICGPVPQIKDFTGGN